MPSLPSPSVLPPLCVVLINRDLGQRVHRGLAARNHGHGQRSFQVKFCDFTIFEEPGATSPMGCGLSEDFCPTDFDDPTGKELYEYYCIGNEPKFEKYTCPNGCQNGACIK